MRMKTLRLMLVLVLVLVWEHGYRRGRRLVTVSSFTCEGEITLMNEHVKDIGPCHRELDESGDRLF